MEVSATVKRFLLALLLVGCTKNAEQPLRIAAASDLTEAFGALAPTFERDAKTKVTVTFGSSGLLAKQIKEGAPFDLFASANVQFVNEVVQSGACDASTVKTYARGRLAMLGTNVDDAARIAIANPAHAPYGKATQEALQKLGKWEAVQPRLVFTENVRQAVQLADTGNADVAFVAWSNVIDRDGGVTLVDEALYAPIEQSLVVCTRGSNAEFARRFVRFLETESSRVTMERFGFH